MKNIIIAFALGALFSLSACSHNWGNFREIAMVAPATAKEAGIRIQGKDCGFFAYWYTNSVAAAARDALRQAPGATGLKNVDVSFRFYLFWQCMVVDGTPVKE